MQRATRSAQRPLLKDLPERQPTVHAFELGSSDIHPPTISRAVADGDLLRITRGPYQHSDGEIDAGQPLADASKLLPRGVVAMTSVLAFHGLNDQMPPQIWIAISKKDWAPVISYPPIRIVKLSEKYKRDGIELHRNFRIEVPIFSVAKTLADVFRRKLMDRSVAIEGLPEALRLQKAARLRKAAPAEIAKTFVETFFKSLKSELLAVELANTTSGGCCHLTVDQ